MARNAGGTYSLPAGNPVVAGTLITDTWANATMPDIGNEITNSLDRNGRGGMLAALRGVDGSVGAPAFSYTSEPTSGWYRAGAGAHGFALLGAAALAVDANQAWTMYAPTGGTVPHRIIGINEALRLDSTAANVFMTLYRQGVNTFYIQSLPAQTAIVNLENTPLDFYTNANMRMRITAGGVIQDANGIELGYRSIPSVASAGATMAVAERGKCYAATGSMTVPNATFAAGDCVSVYNNSGGNITITQGASLTLRLAGTATTGNRTLAQRGFCTVWFISSSEAVISGGGLT